MEKYRDDIVKLWMGPNLGLVIQNPKHIESVVSNPNALDKPYFLNSFQEVLGQGLITSSGMFHNRFIMLYNNVFLKVIKQVPSIF